jgi:hypothetical protein
MWGGSSAFINGMQHILVTCSNLYFVSSVSFDATSQGNLATIIYEWADVQYLGKETTTDTEEPLPVRTIYNVSFSHLNA